MSAPFDREALLARSFEPETRRYSAADSAAWARDFGAGRPGGMALADAPFLDPAQVLALPMIAVPLCDGEFWQQRPDTGIDWRGIVHAEERLTVHRPLPAAGAVTIGRSIAGIWDRGAGRGAGMLEHQRIVDQASGQLMAEVDVTTVLRSHGGFCGPPADAARPAPLPERTPDAQVTLRTPLAQDTRLCISGELGVAAGAAPAGQRMLRGVACFGLAGRAALWLACANDPARLRHFGVRYSGPMFTGETMRLDLWRLSPAEAVFRMWAVERDAAVVGQGSVGWI